METVKDQWFPRVRVEGGISRWAQRVFRAVRLFPMVLGNTCHYIRVTTHRLYNTKSES